MKGFAKKLAAAEKEYAEFPSQSTLDRVTYLRGLHELPGSPLTVDQANTLRWISAGNGRANGRTTAEITGLRKRDLTCIEKQRGDLVERAKIRGVSWIFVSDMGRFYLREIERT